MLKGKNIIITGASRGIGRTIAFQAAENGARIGINYLNSKDEAEKLSQEVSQFDCPEPVIMQFDATSKNEIEENVTSFIDRYEKIDGWVNNAAVNIPGLLPMLTEEEISEQINSALIGPILCTRSVVPHMMGQRSGSIVNIGSVVSEKVFRGQSVYAAAKGGIRSFTKAIAVEYGRKNVRVNCVQPGPVATDMFEVTRQFAGDDIKKRIPLGDFTSTEEVASVVVFLLSDKSSSITGECINVDGGFTVL